MRLIAKQMRHKQKPVKQKQLGVSIPPGTGRVGGASPGRKAGVNLSRREKNY
jgi:hypothetical protein